MDRNMETVFESVEWSRTQADFWRLTKNSVLADRHEQVAQELEWMRKDLYLTMQCLNVVREAMAAMREAAAGSVESAGGAVVAVPLAEATRTLNLVNAVCDDSEKISDNAIYFYNGLKAIERARLNKEN